jgi:hypothetical protein
MNVKAILNNRLTLVAFNMKKMRFKALCAPLVFDGHIVTLYHEVHYLKNIKRVALSISLRAK